MSNTPRSWKPTTSASTDFSSDSDVTRQSSDRPTSRPVASMTSPTTRVTRPCPENRGMSPMRDASLLRSMDLRHAAVRAFERGVDAAVDDALAAFDQATATRDARIGHPARVALAGDRTRITARGGENREIDRVHTNANTLIDREFRERSAYETRDEVFVEGDFASDDLARDDDGDRGDVLLENRRSHRVDFAELCRDL